MSDDIRVGDWVVVKSRGSERRIDKVRTKRKAKYSDAEGNHKNYYFSFGVTGFITADFKLINENRRRGRVYADWELEKFDAKWIDDTWGQALRLCQEEDKK